MFCGVGLGLYILFCYDERKLLTITELLRVHIVENVKKGQLSSPNGTLGHVTRPR